MKLKKKKPIGCWPQRGSIPCQSTSEELSTRGPSSPPPQPYAPCSPWPPPQLAEIRTEDEGCALFWRLRRGEQQAVRGGEAADHVWRTRPGHAKTWAEISLQTSKETLVVVKDHGLKGQWLLNRLGILQANQRPAYYKWMHVHWHGAYSIYLFIFKIAYMTLESCLFAHSIHTVLLR